jgi:hypothetical protein
MRETTEPELDEEAVAFLTLQGLRRLWTAARTRLEHNGLQPTGTIRLQHPDAREGQVLPLLLARPITGPTATIRLPDLDTRLRASAVSRGLAPTLAALRPPLTDSRAARDAAEAERNRVWSTADADLAATPLADPSWAHQWLTEI